MSDIGAAAAPSHAVRRALTRFTAPGSASAPPIGTDYVPTLDGWRAIAILLVILAHATDAVLCQAPEADACRLTRTGDNGVNLFFALSGFLITTRLLAEGDAHGRISLRDFYIRRAFRILPAALAYLAVVATLGWFAVIPVGLNELSGSVAFYRNYLPKIVDAASGAGWYTAHYWSLGVEEHFYLMWPLLLVLFGARRAATVAVLLIIAIACWRWWDARALWSDAYFPGAFGTRSDVRLDGLFAGCAAAILLRDAHLRRVATGLASPVLLVGVFLFFVGFGHPVGQKLPVQVILAPLLVIGTTLRPNALSGRVLEWPVLRWLGRLSYSLYLWQQLFFPPLEFGVRVWNSADVALRVAALFGCALLSYVAIEKPLLRVGRRFAGRNAKSGAAGEPVTSIAAA